MRDYADKDPDDVTAMFRIAYDVANRRCDVCERCGKAPVSKALRITDRFGVRSTRRRTCLQCATPATTPVGCRRRLEADEGAPLIEFNRIDPISDCPVASRPLLTCVAHP